MFVRALAYMMSHGSDGLRHVSGDAVLNANYILAGLKDELTPAFEGTCMHEALFNDSFLEGTGVTTLDFAKAMIDEGYHPMTMYFPLVGHGALLMEPTETESRDGLDRYIESVKGLAKRAKAGDARLLRRLPLSDPAPAAWTRLWRPAARTCAGSGGTEEGGGVGTTPLTAAPCRRSSCFR